MIYVFQLNKKQYNLSIFFYSAQVIAVVPVIDQCRCPTAGCIEGKYWVQPLANSGNRQNVRRREGSPEAWLGAIDTLQSGLFPEYRLCSEDHPFTSQLSEQETETLEQIHLTFSQKLNFILNPNLIYYEFIMIIENSLKYKIRMNSLLQL